MEMHPFGENDVYHRESINKRGAHPMMPPDILFFLQQRRHREMVRRAGLARLVQASGRKPESSERLFQQALRLVGWVLLSWRCALQQAGRATQAAEKGCSVCL